MIAIKILENKIAEFHFGLNNDH